MIKLRDFNFTVIIVIPYYPCCMDGEMGMLMTKIPKRHAGKNPSFLSKKKVIPRNKYLNVADRICKPQSK